MPIFENIARNTPLKGAKTGQSIGQLQKVKLI